MPFLAAMGGASGAAGAAGAAGSSGESGGGGMMSGMSSPLSALGSLTQTAGGVISTISAFKSKDQSNKVGYSLTPEEEIQFLNQMQDRLQQINQGYQQVNDLYNEYQQRMGIINDAVKGSIPSGEAQKALTDSSIRIAQSLGMSSEDLVKNGFITEGDKGTLDKIQTAIDQGAKGQYQDPQLEQQIKDQRRQLQQDLQRQGIPASQQAIALQQFDQSSQNQRFQRSIDLSGQQIGQYSNLLNQQAGLRNQGFSQALGGLQGLQSQVAFGNQNAGYAANIYGQQFQTGGAYQGLMQGLRSAQANEFAQRGQFILGKTGQLAQASGLVGPGTVYNQTGVSNYGGLDRAYTQKVQQNEYNQSLLNNNPDLSGLSKQRFIRS